MVNIKELRIGNLFKCETGETLIVHGISPNEKRNDGATIWYGDELGFYIDSSEAMPILLTENIVLKTGLELREWGESECYAIKYKRAKEDGGGQWFFVAKYNDDWVSAVQNVEDEELKCPLNLISYLHQLQNIYFALTGDEFDIDMDF